MYPTVFKLKNRATIIITAKQPFVDWLNNHPLSKTDQYGPTRLEIVNHEPHVYLMPFRENDDIDHMVEVSKPFFLDAILPGYFIYEKDWPTQRDNALFDQWFTVSWASMVFDLAEDNIEKEEFRS